MCVCVWGGEQDQQQLLLSVKDLKSAHAHSPLLLLEVLYLAKAATGTWKTQSPAVGAGG